jgi:hypothetical protein
MEKSRVRKVLKGVVDILLLVGLIACGLSSSVFEGSREKIMNGADPNEIFSWGTIHCIIALVFVGIILIHIWQHWPFIKALVSGKLYSKHILMTIVLVLFALTVISFLFFLTGFSQVSLHNHSLFAHIFVLIVVVHFVTRFKSLIRLFKKDCKN